MKEPEQWNPSPLQETAVEFGVVRAGCGLMLDPGLGKTSVSLAIASLVIASGDVLRILVVAPLRVAETVWPAEARKWTDFSHLQVTNLCGLDQSTRLALLKKQSHIYVINPESLEKVLNLITDAMGFDMLILDESTKFKDTQTKRFKALKKHLWRFKRKIILTGTPVPNGLADLFGQIYVLDNGERLGRFITHFRMEYQWQPPGQMYTYNLRPGAAEEIYQKVGDILLRAKAVDHLKMPELIPNFREVVLPPGLMKQYKALDDDFITTVEDTTIATFSAAAAGIKCRQFANGFLYHTDESTQVRTTIRVHDEKLNELEELLDEMQGRPLLLAYEFEADAVAIQSRFPGAVNLGKSRNTGKVVNDFNNGLIPLLIAQTAAASHGLNLQEACGAICWFGVTWDLELYIQFIARVWRKGQKGAQVVVHHIVARGTRDEKVMAAIRAKTAEQDSFDAAIISMRQADLDQAIVGPLQ